jgi:hypothetical protein
MLSRVPSIRYRAMVIAPMLVFGLLTTGLAGVADAGVADAGVADAASAACTTSYFVGTAHKWNGKVRAHIRISRSSGCTNGQSYGFRLVRKEGLWPVIDEAYGTIYPGSTKYFSLLGTCKSGTHPYVAFKTSPYDEGGTRRITC